MKKTINAYGFDRRIYPLWQDTIFPYQFKKNGNVVYVRFHNKSPTQIQRITKDDNDGITIEWTYGDWDECESLEYVEINQTIEIEED